MILFATTTFNFWNYYRPQIRIENSTFSPWTTKMSYCCIFLGKILANTAFVVIQAKGSHIVSYLEKSMKIWHAQGISTSGKKNF